MSQVSASIISSLRYPARCSSTTACRSAANSSSRLYLRMTSSPAYGVIAPLPGNTSSRIGTPMPSPAPRTCALATWFRSSWEISCARTARSRSSLALASRPVVTKKRPPPAFAALISDEPRIPTLTCSTDSGWSILASSGTITRRRRCSLRGRRLDRRGAALLLGLPRRSRLLATGRRPQDFHAAEDQHAAECRHGSRHLSLAHRHGSPPQFVRTGRMEQEWASGLVVPSAQLIRFG